MCLYYLETGKPCVIAFGEPPLSERMRWMEGERVELADYILAARVTKKDIA